jgi:hypothetical protein
VQKERGVLARPTVSGTALPASALRQWSPTRYVPTYGSGAKVLNFFWNFKGIQTDNDTIALAKRLKIYWFLRICIPNLQINGLKKMFRKNVR